MASRGGKRNGAGRKPGALTKATREIAEREVLSGDLTPLEYMLRVMRDEGEQPARRDDMAKAAAPFIHARLQAIEANVAGKITLGDMLDAALNR
jgi:hypothetical protein